MDDTLQIVGKSTPRLDAYKKVRGQQRFMSDIDIPGALWAAIVRSPHAHARVKAIDIDAALARPGVVAVYTADDVPDVTFNPAAAPPSMQLDASADKHLLTSEAQHIGDGVAVVVAQTKAAARAAAKAQEPASLQGGAIPSPGNACPLLWTWK